MKTIPIDALLMFFVSAFAMKVALFFADRGNALGFYIIGGEALAIAAMAVDIIGIKLDAIVPRRGVLPDSSGR